MADIQKYLDDIKSAVYGEEVRGSIHDAIKAINETGAGDGKLNTRNEDGIVTKGKYASNLVWATDSIGNPAWRAYYNPNQIVTFTNYDQRPGNTDGRYFRIIAYLKFKPSSYGGYDRYQSFSFDMHFSSAETTGTDIRMIAGFNVPMFSISSSDPIRFTFKYYSQSIYPPLAYSVPTTFCIFHTNGTMNNDVMYLAMQYKRDITVAPEIYIYNLNVTPNITFNWRLDDNLYIDVSRTSDSSYVYYNYFQHYVSWAPYDPTVSTSNAGTVPALPSSHNNMLLGTNGSGALNWQAVSSLGFQTSAQVQEAISTAIASADFSSFEIVSAVPDPSEAKENKFYLVKNKETNHYDIYAKIGENVEWIDDTTVDLTDYATKEELPTSVSELTNDANYTSLTDEQYNTLLQLLGEE